MGFKGKEGEEILEMMGDTIEGMLKRTPGLETKLKEALSKDFTESGVPMTHLYLRAYIMGYLESFEAQRKLKNEPLIGGIVDEFGFAALQISLMKNFEKKLRSATESGLDTTKMNITNI